MTECNTDFTTGTLECSSTISEERSFCPQPSPCPSKVVPNAETPIKLVTEIFDCLGNPYVPSDTCAAARYFGLFSGAPYRVVLAGGAISDSAGNCYNYWEENGDSEELFNSYVLLTALISGEFPLQNVVDSSNLKKWISDTFTLSSISSPYRYYSSEGGGTLGGLCPPDLAQSYSDTYYSDDDCADFVGLNNAKLQWEFTMYQTNTTTESWNVKLCLKAVEVEWPPGGGMVPGTYVFSAISANSICSLNQNNGLMQFATNLCHPYYSNPLRVNWSIQNDM